MTSANFDIKCSWNHIPKQNIFAVLISTHKKNTVQWPVVWFSLTRRTFCSCGYVRALDTCRLSVSHLLFPGMNKSLSQVFLKSTARAGLVDIKIEIKIDRQTYIILRTKRKYTTCFDLYERTSNERNVNINTDESSEFQQLFTALRRH